MEELLAVAFGYLVGSVPFAFVLARRRGIDLRHAGSGNVGATNVLRTSGAWNAVAAMGLDALKGALAVVVAQRLAAGPATPVAAGLAAIIGHVYPVWLRFHGGKGVATSAGAFGVLAPVAVTAAAALFVATVAATRYMSVGSLAAAIALPIVAAVAGAPAPVVVGAALSAAIVIHRHRGNLTRVIAGTERRVGQRLN
jgi:glycerol-3-phosphate acyltransferase PlsY